jgi:hypothetical protein
MIKGVNRKIIEVNNPDSLFFEKAILYVKPNVTVFHEAISRKEAQKLIKSLTPEEFGSVRQKRRRRFIFLAIAAITAIALFMLLFKK